MLCGVALSAQNYYQVGVDYVYRSLKNDDDTKVSILTVQFNASGVASITGTEETSLSSDEPAMYALAPMSDIVVSSSTGDPTELEITADGNQYLANPCLAHQSPKRRYQLIPHFALRLRSGRRLLPYAYLTSTSFTTSSFNASFILRLILSRP